MAIITGKTTIDTFYLYLLMAAAVFIPMLMGILIMRIHKAIPWAWPMYRCFANNVPAIIKHHPKGITEVAQPKVEKELKEGIPHTYFTVDKWGLKLPDIAGDNTEILNGKLRVIHYFKNMVGPVNPIDAASIDMLSAWLNSKGVNILNKEDVIMFFLNDYAKTQNIKRALEDSSIDDDETRKLVLQTIRVIEQNKDELIKLKLKDGPFMFQTAMMALDKTIAFTSSAYANSKSAIQAQERAKQQEDKNKDLYKYVIFSGIFLVMAVFAYLILSKGG